MATFAKSTFNASVYSSSRPTYPQKLFDYILDFHRRGSSGWQRAVDVGCGTGQATAHLRSFREVVGIDPSAGMLAKAKASLQGGADGTQFKFAQGSAEDLSKAVADESVDLMISAQAAHWFDWSKMWPETSRCLKQNGTAAFWVYAEFRLTKYPSLTPRITAYAQGSDPATSLGPHFQRPGRTILERHLVDVPEPPTTLGLQPLTRVYFCGDDTPPCVPIGTPTLPVIMYKEMRWRDLLGYFRTWSPLLTYHEKYPEDLQREEDPRFLAEDMENCTGSKDDVCGGDIAIRFWKDLRQSALEANPSVPVGAEDLVMVEWPLALILTKKNDHISSS